MKRWIPITPFLLLLLCSCKHYIQQKEQDALEAVVTSGEWYVSGYKINDSDITSSFSGYLFKFDADNTVIATLGSNPSGTTGDWSDNISARTVTANFPGAVAPLVYLNTTWTITDSYTDSVSAKSVFAANNTTNYLQLKKQ